MSYVTLQSRCQYVWCVTTHAGFREREQFSEKMWKIDTSLVGDLLSLLAVAYSVFPLLYATVPLRV